MERDEKGRFLKGNSGNPKGRRKRSTEDAYLATLQKCATTNQWKAICKKAIKQAKKGDHAARRWLSDYLLGKPPQELMLDAKGDLAIILRWDDDNSDADSAEAA